MSSTKAKLRLTSKNRKMFRLSYVDQMELAVAVVEHGGYHREMDAGGGGRGGQ